MPETCSPMPNEMICPTPPAIQFPDAGGFCCFRCDKIEPFLEKCGAR